MNHTQQVPSFVLETAFLQTNKGADADLLHSPRRAVVMAVVPEAAVHTAVVAEAVVAEAAVPEAVVAEADVQTGSPNHDADKEDTARPGRRACQLAKARSLRPSSLFAISASSLIMKVLDKVLDILDVDSLGVCNFACVSSQSCGLPTAWDYSTTSCRYHNTLLLLPQVVLLD